MNIKKKLGILLIVIVAVSGLVGYYRVSYAGNLEAVTEGISESIIRFHVRANSDSQEDQEVKLKVKEAVVDYIRPALSESDSLSESRAILEAESDNIRNVAIKTLRNNGFSYDPWGRVVFYNWNGIVARGIISDGVYLYNMDYYDGHFLDGFSIEDVLPN